MDAHAHLLSLGWAGPGHALDARPYKQKGHRGLAYDPKQVRSSDTGNGLVKPLLVSQRQNRFGIGKKSHEPARGNEWWLKGFETALGNIGKSESERTSGTATPDTTTASGYQGKHAGLYEFFVKGQQLVGTMDQSISRPSKRKSDTFDSEGGASPDGTDSAEDGGRKKRKSGVGAAEAFEQIGAFMAQRDKDETRRRRKERLSALEEFERIGQFFEVRAGKGFPNRVAEGTPTLEDEDDATTSRSESKEERRERRRRRRGEKEARRAASTGSNSELEKAVLVHGSADVARQDAAEKAARKAERKKRKADDKQRLPIS